jgi:hypothetical protein
VCLNPNGDPDVKASQTPLFPSQQGGHLTPGSMARFLKCLYREAAVASANIRALARKQHGNRSPDSGIRAGNERHLP